MNLFVLTTTTTINKKCTSNPKKVHFPNPLYNLPLLICFTMLLPICPLHALPIASHCATSFWLFNNVLPPQSSSCSLHNDYAQLFQISTILVYSSSPHKQKKEKKDLLKLIKA
jgi:hypothetical protein